MDSGSLFFCSHISERRTYSLNAQNRVDHDTVLPRADLTNLRNWFSSYNTRKAIRELKYLESTWGDRRIRTTWWAEKTRCLIKDPRSCIIQLTLVGDWNKYHVVTWRMKTTEILKPRSYNVVGLFKSDSPLGRVLTMVLCLVLSVEGPLQAQPANITVSPRSLPRATFRWGLQGVFRYEKCSDTECDQILFVGLPLGKISQTV